MKTFILEINCENAAFDGDPMEEVLRILQAYIDGNREAEILRDFNGNPVGKVHIYD